MKFTITGFKVGQLVQAEVKETLVNGDIIAGFRGDLLRVHNQTQKRFATGSVVELEVRTIRPLSFRLAERARVGFRVSV